MHSHYQRSLTDLPCQGQIVVLRVQVRRFRCATKCCPRRVFTERLPEVTAPRARRTTRLADLQCHLSLALGGEAGSRLARRLTMPVSATTVLEMVRRGAADTPRQAPRVLGVDDWAWCRGRRYGTILCDLERRRVIDLQPDRQAGTFADWLRQHPGVEVISRDRGGSYADGARQGAPAAIQVADRWHLLENCSRALLEAVRRRQADLRAAITTEPALPSEGQPPMTSAGRRQWDRWRRNRQACEEARRLHREGRSIKIIARELQRGRNTIWRWLRGAASELHRPRRNSLEPYRAILERRWAEGCRNAAQLWRDLHHDGFRGSLRIVTEWATRQRLALQSGRSASGFVVPPARKIARMLGCTKNRDEPQINAEQIAADCVVVAAGAWAPEVLKPVDVSLAVAPQRGQITHLQLEGVDTEAWPVVLPQSSHYLLAFGGSRVVVGATREIGSGFDYRVTAAGQAEVLNEALAVAPGLGSATLLETRIGFRPMGPDLRPMLGRIPGADGLVVGNGLGSSGLTIGPFAGRLLAQLVLGQAPELDLAAYDPRRPAAAATGGGAEAIR